VAYATEVLVESETLRRKIPAQIEYLALVMDLAVLRVEDESFFDLHPPADLDAELPASGDRVLVLGYPEGGTTLSKTEGVVSRVEFASFYYSGMGYRIQIDAAVNNGNSGGPAFIDGKLAGIVFSRIQEAENIGYVIAAKEIIAFLDDVADGAYDGKPWIPLIFGVTENPALRSMLGLGDDTTGATVQEEVPWDPDYPLKVFDVVTHIGGYDIDDRAMVRLDNGTFVHLRGVVQDLARDGAVPMTVWRDGELVQLEAPTFTSAPLLIPEEDGLTAPSYLIYGPLVFSPVDLRLAYSLMGSGHLVLHFVGAGNPIVCRGGEYQNFPGEQLVAIVAPPFAHPSSRGMGNGYANVVKAVNGVPIRNFHHFVELLRDADSEHVVIELVDFRMGHHVLKREEIDEITDEILRQNGIRDQMSPDIRAVWQESR
jgi:S1-C subfamily serine protease